MCLHAFYVRGESKWMICAALLQLCFKSKINCPTCRQVFFVAQLLAYLAHAVLLRPMPACKNYSIICSCREAGTAPPTRNHTIDNVIELLGPQV
jgi:hypothetical protein